MWRLSRKRRQRVGRTEWLGSSSLNLDHEMPNFLRVGFQGPLPSQSQQVLFPAGPGRLDRIEATGEAWYPDLPWRPSRTSLQGLGELFASPATDSQPPTQPPKKASKSRLFRPIARLMPTRWKAK